MVAGDLVIPYGISLMNSHNVSRNLTQTWLIPDRAVTEQRNSCPVFLSWRWALGVAGASLNLGGAHLLGESALRLLSPAVPDHLIKWPNIPL